ncbi:hypothetical protein L1987_36554 [Smallanthus sonchifolius]|uniref:Uncharacterized protein n=1 Tax=Smallanthus sonchifolius TaxID=185202 RepID=A0ACB9HF99_9ASTR|nr:hypothetical protein L1987_36554 [Smallanthus sonchifolius]
MLLPTTKLGMQFAVESAIKALYSTCSGSTIIASSKYAYVDEDSVPTFTVPHSDEAMEVLEEKASRSYAFLPFPFISVKPFLRPGERNCRIWGRGGREDDIHTQNRNPNKRNRYTEVQLVTITTCQP